jgi:hypothetical protein
MGTELAILEPILPPDVRRPAKLSTLPQWVERRCASCRKESQPGPDGAYRMVPTLPAALIPSQEQKMLIERHVVDLNEVLAMTPYEDEIHGQLTLTTVTKMTLVLPSREAGDLAGEAKGEAYMAALEDVPRYDYKWQPAPATLRELAMLETYRVMGVRRKLQELLIAESLVEYSDEHCAGMKEKLSELMRGFALAKSA